MSLKSFSEIFPGNKTPRSLAGEVVACSLHPTTYKNRTKQSMLFRCVFSSELMNKMNMVIGDRVDIVFDAANETLSFNKVDKGGWKVLSPTPTSPRGYQHGMIVPLLPITVDSFNSRRLETVEAGEGVVVVKCPDELKEALA